MRIQFPDRAGCRSIRRLALAGVALWFTAIIISGASAETLTVAVKPIEPFVISQGGAVRGFSVDVWNLIADKLGAETRFDLKTTVNEVLEAVETRGADAAIAAITVNAEREEHVDFAHPYFKAGLRVAIPARLGPTWFSTLRHFFSADTLGMFGALVGLTFLTANVLWFVERRVNPECFPHSYLTGVGESIWWSVATIITGGCENKAPVSLPGRLVAVAWMLGSIVLVASFTATMSSQMTTESVAGVISGPEGLPGRAVATVGGTAVVSDLRSMNAHVIACRNIDEAIKAVAAGRADAVVFDAPVLAYRINSDDRCPVRLVGPTFESQDYGIALPSGSPLRKRVNLALLQLHESGQLADLSRKWFGTAD